MMRRTPLKPSSKPMRRSAFLPLIKPSQKEGKKLSVFKSSRRPQMTPIRASAKDQDCTIRLPGICNQNPQTTVLCHSNQLADGKGMGIKAPDTCAAYGCSACHDVVDGRAPRPDGMSYDLMLSFFERGIELTREILQRKGLM